MTYMSRARMRRIIEGHQRTETVYRERADRLQGERDFLERQYNLLRDSHARLDAKYWKLYRRSIRGRLERLRRMLGWRGTQG